MPAPKSIFQNGYAFNERLNFENNTRDIEIEINGIAIPISDIGYVFGSQLGRYFLGGNVVTNILSGTAVGIIGENLFETVGYLAFSSRNLSESIEDAFQDIDSELTTQFQNAAIGAVSSYLTAELIDALGLDGFGGQLASTVGNTVINNVLTNIINGNDAFSNIGSGLPGAIGSFLGSKLANQIISADTVAGQLGGSIGGSIGSIVAGKIVGSIVGSKITGILGNFILPGIGALLGTLLGTLIGDLFGKTPQSGADLEYNPSTGQFFVGAAWKRGKGSKETAEALAGQVGDTLNGVIGLIGGTILNPESIEAGQYGMYKSQYRYQTGWGRKAPDIKFTEAGDLIAFGALVALENAQILGGDIYLKRALSTSLENQKQGAKTLVSGVVSTAFRPANDNERSHLLRHAMLRRPRLRCDGENGRGHSSRKEPGFIALSQNQRNLSCAA